MEIISSSGQSTDQSTKTWIFRHPLNLPSPPKGYRQVEVVQSTPTFEQARNVVAKMSQIQNENNRKRGAAHYGVRDYYTILEMPQGASAEDALKAFFGGTEIRKEFISS